MTGYIGSFDRKSVNGRDLTRTREEYNPTRVEYYSSGDELIHIEETWRGKTFSQTISGSNYSQQWPSYSYSVTHSPWEETTVSSTASTTYSGVNHAFIAYPY